MADFKTVFDADGDAIKLDHVDAREYLATGRYTEAPVNEAEAVAKVATDQLAREAAAKIMTAEKDGVAIREASPPVRQSLKGGGKSRTKK